MRFRSVYAALAALLILLSACSLPVGTPSSAPDLVATITAQARAPQSLHSATPPPVPVTGLTATPAGVQVSATAPTNCRSGPSTAYTPVVIVSPGASYRVVGKYTAGNYWIIANPAGGTCWLWGQYAVVTGDIGSLPEYTPPALIAVTATPPPPTGTAFTTAAPTATGSPAPTMTITPTSGPTHAPPPPPAAPTALSASRTCTVGSGGGGAIWIEIVTVTWHDTSGERGYRIYQDGAAVSTIVQNSVSYQIQLRYNQGNGALSTDTFAIEAYNNGGTSAQLSVTVPRCP